VLELRSAIPKQTLPEVQPNAGRGLATAHNERITRCRLPRRSLAAPHILFPPGHKRPAGEGYTCGAQTKQTTRNKMTATSSTLETHAATIAVLRPKNFGTDAKNELADLQRDHEIFQGDFDKADRLKPSEQYIEYRRSNREGQKTEQHFFAEKEEKKESAKTRLIVLCTQAYAVKARLSNQLAEVATTRADEVEAEERKRFDQYKIRYVPSVCVTTLRELAQVMSNPPKAPNAMTSPRTVLAPILGL
jgi:hypothetical protein